MSSVVPNTGGCQTLHLATPQDFDLWEVEAPRSLANDLMQQRGGKGEGCSI